MVERPTSEARYTPGRDANGHFLPGNAISHGAKSTDMKALSEAKRNFAALVSDDQRAALWASLYDLCMHCPVADVRHKALVYAMDRLYGKPRERVDVEVEGGTNVNVANFNLSPEQVALLKQIGSSQPLAIEGNQP